MIHEYGDCTYCGGHVVERLLRKPCFWGDELVAVIHDVPTGVCEQCGEQFYRADVLREIEDILDHHDSRRKIEVPLYDYAETKDAASAAV